jgi:hypothetical protein
LEPTWKQVQAQAITKHCDAIFPDGRFRCSGFFHDWSMREKDPIFEGLAKSLVFGLYNLLRIQSIFHPCHWQIVKMETCH